MRLGGPRIFSGPPCKGFSGGGISSMYPSKRYPKSGRLRTFFPNSAPRGPHPTMTRFFRLRPLRRASDEQRFENRPRHDRAHEGDNKKRDHEHPVDRLKVENRCETGQDEGADRDRLDDVPPIGGKMADPPRAVEVEKPEDHVPDECESDHEREVDELDANRQKLCQSPGMGELPRQGETSTDGHSHDNHVGNPQAAEKDSAPQTRHRLSPSSGCCRVRRTPSLHSRL